MTGTRIQVNHEHLEGLLNRFKGRRVLLVGDLVADHYIKGKSSRISREAPVLILKYQEETVIPGQVGNTAANIAALGGEAILVGVIGNDARGEQLLDALGKAGVNTDGVVRSQAGSTLTKTRILAGGHHTARQQVIRIDDDERMALDETDQLVVLDKMRDLGKDIHAIIVSDYGYGVVNHDTWTLAKNLADTYSIPILLDSRYSLAKLQGATLITPNEEEALQTAGIDKEPGYNINDVGHRVKALTHCENLIITRGNEGMVLFGAEADPIHLPIFGSDECTDVTGAGDTVVATAALAMATGGDPLQAMLLSNLAGALVVMKMGTATITYNELLNALPAIGNPI